MECCNTSTREVEVGLRKMRDREGEREGERERKRERERVRERR
jgi:hypothetical protein